MRKFTLTLFIVFVSVTLFAQNNFWSSVNESALREDIFRAAGSNRPGVYKLFQLNEAAMKAALLQAPPESGTAAGRSSFLVSFPNGDGILETFRVVNAPVMAPQLSARYPGINSYLGQGITDPSAVIRFDVSMHGLHATILYAAKSAVYIDQLYQNFYRVVKRSDVTDTPNNFKCLTDAIPHPSTARENAVENVTDGKLRTYRLAMISGAEFSNHFIPSALPTLADSIAAVLAAQNSHVTRTNAVYERDFGIRLVLVATNDRVIYFDPATDPVSNPNSPNNTLLQNALDGQIGSGNYDIGHTESKGSDNGNAGCIGCVCTAGSKGRGWTVYSNPSLLEFFVIDYLTHEMGHQFGANHTFSFSTEGTGVNVEPGSGVTIMGYAGIVAGQNVALHSIELFSVKSIEQVSNYILSGNGSGCDVETITGNTAPTANAGADFTIPFSTPFKLTGTGTDPDPADVLSYNWEQIDNRTGAFSSIPSPSATDGPMFRTYLSYPIPERTFPELQYILTGANGFQWEVLPAVGRPLNFRFIVKDNHVGGGGTRSDDMVVTVSGTTGPFLVSTQNSAVSYQGGTTQTVNWSVNGTTGAPVNCAFVNILFSSDGGQTFPTVLAANTANDGTENITIPVILTSTGRIKVEAVGNIFFDINNANITVTAPPSGFVFNSPSPVTTACPAGATMSVTLGTTSNGGFSNPITLSATAGVPAGTTVSFGTNPVTPGNSSLVTLNNTNTLAAGTYVITITGTATGAPTQTRDLTFTITGTAGPAITTQPSNSAICVTANTSFSIAAAAATAFQWQISTDGGATYSNVTNAGVYSGATTNTLTITGATIGLNNNRYRCIASTQCGSSTSNAGILTVNAAPAVTAQPQDITLCAGSNHTFSVTATGGGLTYQWQLSTDGGGTYNNITNGGIYSGATTNSLTLTGLTAGLSGNRYRCVVTGSCPPAVNSNGAILTVVTSVAVTTQPTDATVCEGSNSSFTVAGSGTGIIYQWQVSTDGGTTWTNVTNTGVYSGATAATLNITGATFSLNTYRYRCQLSNATCTTPGVSNAGILTVNTLPAVTTNPANSTICLGGNTSFSAAATGTGIGYQWQVSTDGGTTYTNITNGGVYGGATTTTLTITGATAAMNTYRYRVAVSGTCAPAANSTGAILTVVNPVAITAQPVNSEICSGSNTSFSVTGSSTQTIIYQWQDSTSAHTWQNINGANASTLNLAAVTTGMNGNKYRVVLSNATCFGANETTSGAATLTVRQLPTVALTAAPLTALLPGQSTTLTATPTASTGGVLTTSWFFNNNAVANTGNTRTVNVEQVGDYQVRIQETWPSTLVCSNQSAVVAITAQASERLFIFPSPNDGVFQVAYYNSTGAASSRTITIYNAAGAKVHHEKFAVTGSYTLLNLDIKPAAKGLYYVVVGDASGKRIAKGNVLIQ